LIKKKLLSEDYSSWSTDIDHNCSCYDEEFHILVMLHCAQLLCKEDKIELEDDTDYEALRNVIFNQVSQFFIQLNANSAFD
jgi:hypothetical protein